MHGESMGSTLIPRTVRIFGSGAKRGRRRDLNGGYPQIGEVIHENGKVIHGQVEARCTVAS